MLLFVSSQQKQSPECQAQVQDQKKGGDQAVEARNIQIRQSVFISRRFSVLLKMFYYY